MKRKYKLVILGTLIFILAIFSGLIYMFMKKEVNTASHQLKMSLMPRLRSSWVQEFQQKEF